MTNIKKSRAKIRSMSQGMWRATERLIVLLRQLEQEGGGARGTRAAIHRNTGLDQGVVSDLLNDSGKRKNVVGQTIEKVLRTFRADDGRRLSRGFFFDRIPRGVEPNYRDFLVSPSDAPPPEDDENYTDEEMMEELQPTARELKAMEQQLKRFNYPRVDAYFKRAIIVALRSGRRMQAAIDAAVDKMGDTIAREDDEAVSKSKK